MKAAIIIVFTLLISTGIWWFFLRHHDMNSGTYNHTETSKNKSSQYICPMHPQIISDELGRCPICGMNLVLDEEDEEEEDEEEEENHQGHEQHKKNIKQTEDHSRHDMKTKTPDGRTNLKLSLKKQQMIGVKIGKAQKKELFKSIRAPGRIAFDPELYTAQSEYLEALKQGRRVKNSPLSDVRGNTRQMINSSKIRLKILGLSDSQIKDLANKGFQSEGLLVSGKGQDSWIYADIFEVDLPYIKKGLSAQITANFLQGKTLPGKVISVDQVINPDTRTAKVRIQLLKQDPSIRPESYVNVTIFAPVGEHIAVPLEAIMNTGRKSFVFVKKGEGRFEPKIVSVILETDNEAALRGAIMPGDEIVVGGNFMLDSESRLKSVIQGGASSNGHNH